MSRFFLFFSTNKRVDPFKQCSFRADFAYGPYLAPEESHGEPKGLQLNHKDPEDEVWELGSIEV